MTDPALHRLAKLRHHLLAPAAVGAEVATVGSQHTSAADVQNELQTLLEHDSWQASSVTRRWLSRRLRLPGTRLVVCL